MEGRGSDVEYWRGETHLGLSLPVSVCCFPCPCVVSRVHTSFPMSAHWCPHPHIGAHICASVPVSAHRCPCPRVVAHVCTLLPMSAHCCPCLCVVACVRLCLCRGQQQCGGGELLVGGGELSGLALTCGSVAIVVVSWCQVVRVAVVASGASCSCRIVVWLPHRQLRHGTFGCCQ